ncbi:MAG: M3 family oligoendopeptidase [Ilumatobacter sp.]|nr:M3 family oligoendopeptidase [Ilumatobacter sp.]
MSAPPTWSTDDLYAGFADPAFVADFERLMGCGTALGEVIDRHGIRGTTPRAATAADLDAAAEVVALLDAANDLGRTLYAFIDAYLRIDVTDETAGGLMARLGALMGSNRGQMARFAAWLGEVNVAATAATDPRLAVHAGWLDHLSRRARHQMSEAEETLAAELAASGSAAWTNLHAATTGRLEVEVALPGGRRRMPLAEARGLATHADPAVREAAYRAEMEGWPPVLPLCAAALNGVKGEAAAVNRRRGWPTALDPALFANGVGRDAYDAMTSAVVASLPDFRRVLRAKARLHGHPGPLPWWDLMAPLPGSPAEWAWDDGVALIRDAFGRYGGSLPALLDRALAERWIDAVPRPGKAPGASSMPFFADRSLLFVNWTGGLEQVITVAHELGHAFHNAQLARRPATLRDVPMSLAETASIFCETLFVHTALEQATGADRLALLDVHLCGHVQTVVDIHTRVLFETEVFARRARRTLGVGELGVIMTTAQSDAFGDALDTATLHPHMWAVKRHYYTSQFYNWQYTFGLLFALGLFDRFLAEPGTFRDEYEQMLADAGRATAADLAARFGIDLAEPTFWTRSLDVLRTRIDEYERLALSAS